MNKIPTKLKTFLRRFFLIYLVSRMAFSCSTIVHGTTQKIQVSSNPTKAEVWVDGALMNSTPTTLKLKRKNDYFIRIVKEGYDPVEIKITGKPSAWIIGNVIFGGIIGCGIDFLSGGAYTLSPDRLDVNLPEIDKETGSIILDNSRCEELREIRLIDAKGKPEVVVNLNWQ